MILTVLVSTIDSGINRVPNIILGARTDVNYIVIHQITDSIYKNIPGELLREDVKIFQITGKGLTRSRNYGIMQASGDIAIIADDDVSYRNEYFDLIIETFRIERPDVALFKIKTREGEREYIDYPKLPFKVTIENIHSPSSIEITFNISKIRNIIKFDERFGLGTFLNGGGELFFITDAIKHGLNVRYYPFYVVIHPQESQIMKYPQYHKRRVKVVGAIYARKYGLMAIPRIFIRSLMLIPELFKTSKSPLAYLYQMYTGCFYILLNRQGL